MNSKDEWDRIQAEENQKAQKPRGDAAADRTEGRDDTVNREKAERHERAADYAASRAKAIREGKA